MGVLTHSPRTPCLLSHVTHFLPRPSSPLATWASHSVCACGSGLQTQGGKERGFGASEWDLGKGRRKAHHPTCGPSPATYGRGDPTRSHSAGAGVGVRMGGSESPSLAVLLATREGWTPGAAAPGEPGGRVCASSAGPKPADSVALGLEWGGANTHQPRTSASWSGSSGPWRRPRPAALAAIATRAPSAA